MANESTKPDKPESIAQARSAILAPMTRKATRKRPKHDDPEEYKRFLETARKVEASDDPGDFDRAFKKVTEKRPAKRDK